MARKYNVISADGHVEVPADMWVHHIPSKYQDKTPRLVRHDDGSEWWHLMELQRDNLGNLVSSLDYDEFLPSTGRTYHNPDGSARPGTGTAAQRLREQDLDGLDAEVLYPPVYLGAFFRPMIQRDPDAYLAIIQAYNTFLAEEYCSAAPDRLIGNAMVPELGVAAATGEMERCRKMGLIAMSLSRWPNGGDSFSPDDDRFFAAALDLDMRMSPHQGFGTLPPFGGADSGVVLIEDSEKIGTLRGGSVNFGGIGLAPHNISALMINGVFDRFPKLRFYFAETQAGWIAHYLNMMDEFHQRWFSYTGVKLKKLPSQYVRDHVKFSFISDRVAMKQRYLIGLDLLMWGSDFPHSVGTCPHSREFLDEIFKDVPEVERRQVLVDNVCEFFGLDANKELTPTP